MILCLASTRRTSSSNIYRPGVFIVWIDVELRHLRYFVVLAEELNFTRAAARLYIAQPSLSVQIHQLEAEVGVELLSREGRNVRLTEAGAVFLAKARQTLAQVKASVTAARRAAKGEIGHLRIGYHPPAEFRIFSKIVPVFKAKWPDVHLTFHNMRVPQQLAALRRDELDLAFAYMPVSSEEFDVQELTQEPLVAVLPANHRLASAAIVSVKDLSDEPFVFIQRHHGPESYDEIEQLFLSVGATMNVAYELDNLLSIVDFVAMGAGCSLLPDYWRRMRYDGVVYKPLQPPTPIKILAVVKSKQSGELANLFYRVTVENLPLYVTEKPPKLRARKTPTRN